MTENEYLRKALSALIAEAERADGEAWKDAGCRFIDQAVVADARKALAQPPAPAAAAVPELPEPAGRHPEWDSDAQDYRPTGRHFTEAQMRAVMLAAAPAAPAVEPESVAFQYLREQVDRQMEGVNKALAAPVVEAEPDESKPRSRRDLDRVLTEWNDTTGALGPRGSWYCEVLGMMEDAYDLGAAQPSASGAQGLTAGPVAWSYELATTVDGKGRPGTWEHHLTRFKPTVPLEAIRGLTPLYAHPAPTAAQGEEAAELVAALTEIGDWDHRGDSVREAYDDKHGLGAFASLVTLAALYTHPSPVSQEDAKDAARYRLWRDEYVSSDDGDTPLLNALADCWKPEHVDGAIDAAMSRQEEP